MNMDVEFILRLVLAAAAGGLVGFEREKVHKPAGVRTHMLVSLGSALLVLTTIAVLPEEGGRLIAGVATGIGFLGAGTIFRAKDHVTGLTTAASIWTVAAIGLALGLGEYVLGAAGSILVILILQLKKVGL